MKKKFGPQANVERFGLERVPGVAQEIAEHKKPLAYLIHLFVTSPVLGAGILYFFAPPFGMNKKSIPAQIKANAEYMAGSFYPLAGVNSQFGPSENLDRAFLSQMGVEDMSAPKLYEHPSKLFKHPSRLRRHPSKYTKQSRTPSTGRGWITPPR